MCEARGQGLWTRRGKPKQAVSWRYYHHAWAIGPHYDTVTSRAGYMV